MSRNINHVLRVLAGLPHVVRRRRARGGLSHEQFKDACLIVQFLFLVHCFLFAAIWWEQSHDDPLNWLGVGVAVAWVVFFWWFLLKHAYTNLENAVEKEISR
ncbi:hypothetical protein [Paraburkholderia sp. BCC1876]|uniref:hypothetical protein n=1 Tax=Paraburkholderia sp. BCC1876 TaxID=2676303 RepID=UPI00158FFBAC|nr:hypothetical protein [Paraburkholderia sp. BCC1876]